MSEWGPWTLHDGMGCPCRGMFVRVERRNGEVREAIATGEYNESGSAWDWASVSDKWQPFCIIRYRIRKPRGLTILENLLENLPVEVPA